jgi:hypothetical protein
MILYGPTKLGHLFFMVSEFNDSSDIVYQVRWLLLYFTPYKSIKIAKGMREDYVNYDKS